MIFAPRSCPSRPGFAMTTRILRATQRSLSGASGETHESQQPRPTLLERSGLGRRIRSRPRRAGTKRDANDSRMRKRLRRNAERDRKRAEWCTADVGGFSRTQRATKANVPHRSHGEHTAGWTGDAKARTNEGPPRRRAVGDRLHPDLSADFLVRIRTGERDGPGHSVQSPSEESPVGDAENPRSLRAERDGADAFGSLRSLA